MIFMRGGEYVKHSQYKNIDSGRRNFPSAHFICFTKIKKYAKIPKL